MTRSTTTVVGPVFFGDGTLITNGKLNFKLTTYDKEIGEAFYVSGPFSVDISQTGDFTIDLFDNSKGETDSSYKVSATYLSSTGKTKTEEFGHLFLTGPGPYKFADLSFAPSWIPTNQDLMSQLQGYATAANQAGDFATQAQAALAATTPLAEQVEINAEQVSQDRVATGEDRYQTGVDRYETNQTKLAVEAVSSSVNDAATAAQDAAAIAVAYTYIRDITERHLADFGTVSENADITLVLKDALEALATEGSRKLTLPNGQYVLADRCIADLVSNTSDRSLIEVVGNGCQLILPASNVAGGLKVSVQHNRQTLKFSNTQFLSEMPKGTKTSDTSGVGLEIYSNLRPGDAGWGEVGYRQVTLDSVYVGTNNTATQGRYDSGVIVDGFWFPLLRDVYVNTRIPQDETVTDSLESGDGIALFNSYSPEMVSCYSLGAFDTNIRIDENTGLKSEDFQVTGCYGVGGRVGFQAKYSSAAVIAQGLKEVGGRVSGGHFNGHQYAMDIRHRRQFSIDGPLLYTTIGTKYNYPNSAFIRLLDCHDAVVTGVNIPEGGFYTTDSNCSRHVSLEGTTSNVLINGNLFGANGVAVHNSSTGLRNVVSGNKFKATTPTGTVGPTNKIYDPSNLLRGDDVTNPSAPYVRFGGNTAGITYTQQTGSFVQTGNLVTAEFVIRLSSKGTSTGNATIIIPGMPLPKVGSSQSVLITYTNGFSKAPRTARLTDAGGLELLTFNTLTSGCNVAITNDNFIDTSDLRGSFSYIAES